LSAVYLRSMALVSERNFAKMADTFSGSIRAFSRRMLLIDASIASMRLPISPRLVPVASPPRLILLADKGRSDGHNGVNTKLHKNEPRK
jgi:hypothetical protein